MTPPPSRHRLSGKLLLAAIIIVAVAIIAFGIHAIRNEPATVRGAAGPLAPPQSTPALLGDKTAR
jgi:hypothetical protein